MSGQLYDGRPVGDSRNGVPNNCKAYCEGMQYRSQGIPSEYPITDNWHQAGSETATAWDAGWTLADSFADSTITRDAAGPCAMGGVAILAEPPAEP